MTKDGLTQLQREMAEVHRTFQAAYPGGKVGVASGAGASGLGGHGTPRESGRAAAAAAAGGGLLSLGTPALTLTLTLNPNPNPNPNLQVGEPLLPPSAPAVELELREPG